MKHYYKFCINYTDEFSIYSVNQELKKGDLVVVPIYADEFSVATVVEPISELKALTECEMVEDVITVVDVQPYITRQKALIKRQQLHTLMKERLDEFKELDNYRKMAQKDPKFRTIFEAYQKTELSGEEGFKLDDENPFVDEE